MECEMEVFCVIVGVKEKSRSMPRKKCRLYFGGVGNILEVMDYVGGTAS